MKTICGMPLALILVGCISVKGRYDLGLQEVECPESVQERYGESRIVTLEEEGTTKYSYEDGIKYPFVLQNSDLNLWEGIRNNALAYFRNNNIPWRMSTPDISTGHLLSSQIV
jgi:hypothetical protein